MKTFNRLKNIINSNVNSTLDKIENPEKIISGFDEIQEIFYNKGIRRQYRN